MDSLAIVQKCYIAQSKGKSILLTKKDLPNDYPGIHQALAEVKRHRANSMYVLSLPDSSYDEVVGVNIVTSHTSPHHGIIQPLT